MTKLFKIILVLCIITTLFIGVSYATGDDTIEDEVTNIVENDNNTSTSNNSTSTMSTTVSSVSSLSSLPEANLGLNNILNVLLIAIGFLLILFAIAILIRLKK